MGKSEYTSGKDAELKAKRLKQIEKAARRLAARKRKADAKPGAPGKDAAPVL